MAKKIGSYFLNFIAFVLVLIIAYNSFPSMFKPKIKLGTDKRVSSLLIVTYNNMSDI